MDGNLVTPLNVDLHAILEHSAAGFLVIDREGVICFVNKAAEIIFNRSKEKLLGSIFAHTVSNNRRYAIDIIRLDGSLGNGEISVADIQWSNQPATLVTIYDITKRIEAQRQCHKKQQELQENILKMQVLQAELERSNTELQQFAYAASHDLDEPLRKITTFGSLLQRNNSEGLSKTGEDYLERMVRATMRMRNILDTLFEYSRIQTNSKKHALVHLRTPVNDAMDNLEQQIHKEQAEVHIGELPTLKVERTQIMRLFQNLIANAIKYRRADINPVVHIASEKRDGIWYITVKDNGKGFDLKHAEKIFHPFQQIDGNKKDGGIGMGLAICQRIIKQHQGSINVDSIIDEGSIFYLSFPQDLEKN